MNKLPLICFLLALGLHGCDGTATRGTAMGSAPQDSAADDNTPSMNGDDDAGGDQDAGDANNGGNDADGGNTGGGDTVGGDTDGSDADGGATGGGDAGDAADGALLDCLNPAFATVGTRQVLRYRSSNDSGTLEFSTDILVNRETSFNGIPVLEAVTAEEGATSSNTTQLYTLEPDTGIQRNYRVTSEAQSPVGTVTTTVVFDPFWEVRFDLAVGDSFTADYATTSETQVPGSPAQPPVSQTQVSRTRTYAGQESITVPAGSFTACRIDETVRNDSTNGDSEERNVYWFGVGSGVLIRQTGSDGNGNNTTTTELLSGSVNGVDL